MSEKGAPFRAACRSESRLTIYKEFTDQASAETWARANVHNFDRIEALVSTIDCSGERSGKAPPSKGQKADGA